MLFFLSFAVCATAAAPEKMKGAGFDVTIKPKGDVLLSYDVELPDEKETFPAILSAYDIRLSFPDMGMSLICEEVAVETLPAAEAPPESPLKTLMTLGLCADVPDEGAKSLAEGILDDGEKKKFLGILKSSKCKTREAKYMGREWSFLLSLIKLRDGRKGYQVAAGSFNPDKPDAEQSPDDPFFYVLPFDVDGVGGSARICGKNMGETKNIAPCGEKGSGGGFPWVVIFVVVVLVLLGIGVAVFLWKKKKNTSKQEVRLPVTSQNKRHGTSRRH